MKKYATVKRKVAALTAIVLSLSVLAACGNKDNESDSSKPSVTVEERPVETEVKTETVTATNNNEEETPNDTSSETATEETVQEVVDDSNFDPANIPVVGTERDLFHEGELTSIRYATGLAGSGFTYDVTARDGHGKYTHCNYWRDLDDYKDQQLTFIDIQSLKNTEPNTESKESTLFVPENLSEYSTPVDIPEEIKLTSTKNGFTFLGYPAYFWAFNQSESSTTSKLTDVVFMETNVMPTQNGKECEVITALLFDSDYYNQEILPNHHFLFAPAADSYSGDVNGFRLGDTKDVVERAIGHVALKPGNIEITDEPVKGLEKNGEDGYLYSFYQNYYGTKFIVGYKNNVAKRVIMISPLRDLIG